MALPRDSYERTVVDDPEAESIFESFVLAAVGLSSPSDGPVHLLSRPKPKTNPGAAVGSGEKEDQSGARAKLAQPSSVEDVTRPDIPSFIERRAGQAVDDEESAPHIVEMKARIQSGDREGVRERLDELLDQVDEAASRDLFASLGELFLEQKYLEEALACLFRVAEREFAQGKPEAVRRVLSQVLEADPQNRRAREILRLIESRRPG